MGGSRVTCH